MKSCEIAHPGFRPTKGSDLLHGERNGVLEQGPQCDAQLGEWRRAFSVLSGIREWTDS